ncbi:MAG TPA: hypothetical protein VM265_07500, partial [Sphingomicrobium sp.]|nr:hypothetical protein [Sphingomicrobium sp.]
FGASASQRLYNIVLKPQARTVAGRASTATATDGGANSRSGELSFTDIRRPRRISVALRTRSDGAIRESDRDLDQPAGAPPGLARVRTLRPRLDSSELRLSGADRIAAAVDASLSARLSSGSTRAGLGLDPAGGALEQRSRSRGAALDLQLDTELGEWLVTFNGALSRQRRSTVTDRGLGAAELSSGGTRTLAILGNAGSELSATGPLAQLPAGPLSLTVRTALNRDSITGDGTAFVQWNRELGAALQVPIASAAAGVLAPLGEFGAGLALSRSRVSRIGTLTNATVSLHWQPADWLRLAGSISAGRTPPAVGLIADPLLTTPGVRQVDPLSGETVDVLEIAGGNPALGAQRGASRRLSMQLKPLRKLPLSITAEYSSTGTRDLVTSLSASSGLLLLAFPERFVRDAGGRLLQVDVRPISFARQSEERLRSSAELELPLGSGEKGARLQLNLAHNWLRKGVVEIRDGGPRVDLLSRGGLAIGGSRPRHELDFTLGYAERGLGLRLIGQHRSASFLSLGEGAATDVLRFSPLTTLGLRGFVEGGRLLPSASWLQGTRLSLDIVNITNARERVRDSRGQTPLGYQQAYRDPVGRLVRLEFRKAF